MSLFPLPARPYVKRCRYALRLIPIVGLLLIPPVVYAQQPATPTVTVDFLTKLENASNRRDIATLKALSAPDSRETFDWALQAPGLIGVSKPWQAKRLTIPGDSEGNTFIAFTRYHPAESAGDHLYRVGITPEGARLGEELPETDTLGTRVRDHKLVVRFDVPRKQAWVTDRIQVERQTKTLSGIILRLNSIYTVTSVKQNGTPIPFRQAGGFLALKAGSGDRAVYDLAYHATVDFSSEDYIKPNHAALSGYWYPHTGRLPSTCSVRIICPRDWVGIAQGEPIGRSITATEATFDWKNTLPICYITAAAGKYTVTSKKVGTILVSAYLLKGGPARAQETIRVASGAVVWFSKNFTPFPYKRYAVVETEVFPAALECYSFTLAGSSLIPLAIVHEIAHTWWGGIVPNTYTRSLWNESFAEYSDGLYGRQTAQSGLHEFNTQMLSSQSGLFSSHSLLQARDAMDMGQSAVGYGKGSLVLENLERMLGTPKMLACMRRFIVNHVQKRNGEDAEWPDFIEAVAQVAGEEWRDFFPAWLERTDLPVLRLRDVKIERNGGKSIVTGNIVQMQSSPGAPIFWLQAPLVFSVGEGRNITQKIDVKSAEEPFRVEIPETPKQVALDPEHLTLRATPRQGAASLLALQTLSGPLLIVYATGGTTAETTAAEAVAKEQAQEVFPFATLKVKADKDTTPEELAGSNVLLIGRPDSLQIPAAWRAFLTLRYTDTDITLEGRRWAGQDLWGIVVLPHPSRPKGLIAHVAGTSAEALRNFRHQGDLDSQKGLFIVKGAGKPVFSEAPGKSDGTVVPLSE